jgi:hypothetical protein
VDGVLIRDLQLRPDARSACVLAPLPARAAALAAFAARHRRAMLRLSAGGRSAARARWASATRTLVPPASQASRQGFPPGASRQRPRSSRCDVTHVPARLGGGAPAPARRHRHSSATGAQRRACAP